MRKDFISLMKTTQTLNIRMRGSTGGGGPPPGPLKNKNLLNLHCKIIAKMLRTPPPPPDKHNYPSEPQPLEKFSESAHNSCSELITRVHHLI